ncbi:hypothetical protein CgunFtcFv8_004282 [Champsocephalus gunnari]|uniref:Uncharacterized protein n=1 Tax=Champsocephalus gunnari TaxID=52237 RepID=A0AAN8E076_CHAGU|nr:hypothetical protein CgunFtcFv8_004282 [Champsocephalus gunnari]
MEMTLVTKVPSTSLKTAASTFHVLQAQGDDSDTAALPSQPTERRSPCQHHRHAPGGRTLLAGGARLSLNDHLQPFTTYSTTAFI